MSLAAPEGQAKRRGRSRAKVSRVRFYLRQSEDEQARWRHASQAQGFRNTSAFVRAAVEERIQARRSLHPEELEVLREAAEQARRAGVNVNELLYRAILAAKGAAPEGPARREFEAAAVALKRAAEVLSAVFSTAAHRLERPRG